MKIVMTIMLTVANIIEDLKCVFDFNIICITFFYKFKTKYLINQQKKQKKKTYIGFFFKTIET